jgi:hypothetical protein
MYTQFWPNFSSSKWALFQANWWDLTNANAHNKQNFPLFTVDVAALFFSITACTDLPRALQNE